MNVYMSLARTVDTGSGRIQGLSRRFQGLITTLCVAKSPSWCSRVPGAKTSAVQHLRCTAVGRLRGRSP